MNDRRVYAAHRGVVGKVPTLPAATVKSTSAIAEAIVHSAVKAYGRAPVASVKSVESVGKTPITRRPEEAGLRRGDPHAGYPVITCIAITPVARLPKISVGRARRLLINLQYRWRHANG
jgi:hypothetical protein